MPRQRPPTSGYARIAQADHDEAELNESDEEGHLDPYRRPRTISTAADSQLYQDRDQPQQYRQQPYGMYEGAFLDNGETSPYRKKHGLGYSADRRRRRHGPRRTLSGSGGVDIKAINARFERWAEEIASKFKINKVKGKTADEERLEIQHSVFQAPEGMRPWSAESSIPDKGNGGKYDYDELDDNAAADHDTPNTQSHTGYIGHRPHGRRKSDRMNKAEFEEIVESVRVAIELGVHPKMISQGSSGSYFARNNSGKVVGVFKPKDEEPYATRNPKWTKWVHRNLFPCFFGRACLIPNLSYVSEAAAYVLDMRLQTNLVPYTGIVHLSSKSFHYDFWDRSAYYRGRAPLPSKVGSFQVFLKGFKDANLFLRDNPWPADTYDSGGYSTTSLDASRWRRRPWQSQASRPSSTAPADETSKSASARGQRGQSREPALSASGPFVWTDGIKQSFREELEKLVILDYIMRNTDRGLDNWMIRVDFPNQKVDIVAEAPSSGISNEERPIPVRKDTQYQPKRPSRSPYLHEEAMSMSGPHERPAQEPEALSHDEPKISIGAIDNSLSWPWKHPDAWRSFPFGWLFLPVSLIGQPFSTKTREHFLPLLTSTHWWSETQMALRQVFSQDSDFKEKMFARQIAVMKGQAWNVVETLKTADHGPLELTRRTRVCVWDDLVDVPVAIPMQRPSVEMRRKTEELIRQNYHEEEMDISAAIANANSALKIKDKSSHRDEGKDKHKNKPQAETDLLASPNPDLPNPNRFDLSPQLDEVADQSEDTPRGSNEADEPKGRNRRLASPHKSQRHSGHEDRPLEDLESTFHEISAAHQQGPGSRHNHERQSVQHSRQQQLASSRRRATHNHRRLSGSLRYTNPFQDDDADIDSHGGVDDLEGDIGYSAAEDMEGSRRKVIVERLETVQSKNPVFTWC